MLAARADVQVLALTDRVWQAGEAFARAALLVEEAAVEAGRAALASRDAVACKFARGYARGTRRC